MYAKVFEQIFDSSISEDYLTRLVFEDLLVLADQNGVVDKTHEAISRRTNVPLDIVKRSIVKLESPDPKSRSQEAEGKRIVRLDDHRDWGWFIVNYEHYRALATEEQKREKTRARVQKHRDLKKSALHGVTETLPYAYASAFVFSSAQSESQEFKNAWMKWTEFRLNSKKKPKNPDAMFQEQLTWMSQYPVDVQIEIMLKSIRNDWQGLFEPSTKPVGKTAGKKSGLPNIWHDPNPDPAMRKAF